MQLVTARERGEPRHDQVKVDKAAFGPGLRSGAEIVTGFGEFLQLPSCVEQLFPVQSVGRPDLLVSQTTMSSGLSKGLHLLS